MYVSGKEISSAELCCATYLSSQCSGEEEEEKEKGGGGRALKRDGVEAKPCGRQF